MLKKLAWGLALSLLTSLAAMAQETLTITEPADFAKYLPTGDPSGDELKPGNSLVFDLKWSGGTGTRKFTVILQPTNIQGSSLNTGVKTEPDYAMNIDSDVNKAAVWKIEADAAKVPAYGASWAKTVVKTGVAADTVVKIEIHSFDFGGRCAMRVTAEPESGATGGSGNGKTFPKDTDGDTLPDFWEVKDGVAKQFWIKTSSGTFELKSLKIDSANSGGAGQPADNLIEGSLNLGTTQVHTILGDGFLLYEKYRGLFVQGTHHRFETLANDGPGGGTGGTSVKSVFIFDEDNLLRKENTFLQEAGIVWHKIKKDEMVDFGRGNSPKAGLMNANSQLDVHVQKQHAIWMHKADPKDTTGSHSTTSLNDRALVQIDLRQIESFSKTMGFTKAQTLELQDWVVAHELCHKLGIAHPASRQLSFVASLDVDKLPDNLNTYTKSPDNSFVFYWTPGSKQGVNFEPALNKQDITEIGATAGINAVLTNPETGSLTNALATSVGTITRHDVAHTALFWDYKTNIKKDAAFPSTEVLTTFSHGGFLNDHVPDTSDLQKKLSPADAKLPNPKG